jgi:putative peptidoglycan lipid II flippase
VQGLGSGGEMLETEKGMTVPSSKRPSMGKMFGIVAVLTVISKVIGLARDVVVAAAYGTTFLADSYNYAFMFTGNILILFGGLGGPFHSATVTTLEPRKEQKDSGSLMVQLMAITTLFLGLAALIMIFVAPYLVHWIFAGYGHSEADRLRFCEQTIIQLWIMSPLIVIAGLIGISYGILNVFHRVTWPSLSPAIASLAIIVALWLFPNKESAVPLAVGSLIGALGQLLAQVPDMFACGLRYRLTFKAIDGLRNFTSVLWPAFIGTSIGQLVVYVDGCFGARISEGAWTAIVNANRLVQLPLGVLITAMLVPVLPRFTAHVSKNRIDDLKSDFRRSISFLWFLAMPLTVVLLVLPMPIVRLLFQRGAFNTDSTTLVTVALLFMVPSIVFYIARDLITRVFYAFQDSKTPYYVALCALFVKGLLDYLFVIVIPMGVGGISLATSLITLFNFTCLTVLIRKKVGSLGFTKLFGPIAIMTISSALAGLVMYFSYFHLEQLLPAMTLIALVIKIGVATAAGGATYFILCSVFGLHEPRMLIDRLLKRQPLEQDPTGDA